MNEEMSGMRKNSNDTDHGLPQLRSPNKKSKRSSKHKSSRKRGSVPTLVGTSSHESRPALTRAAIRTSLSSNTLSNYFSNINALFGQQQDPYLFVTRDELEHALKSISMDITKLEANIESLKEEKKHETMEQKLTFLKLIRRSLLIWNAFLVILLFYDTFKQQFLYILLMMRENSETANKVANVANVANAASNAMNKIGNSLKKDKKSDTNAIALMVLFLQNFPTIFRQTIIKAIKTSIPFILALACLIQGTEIWRNTGSALSITYSLFLMFMNYKPKSWKHFKIHFVNLGLNGCFISMRYYWLHGLSSYQNFQSHL